jgi:3-oxoacyl-[acyl-carrier-protein] synthase-3
VIARVPTRAGIVSVGAAVPDGVMTNRQIAELVDTTDEWIVDRTGIRERRVAAPGESVVDLAERAAVLAVERSDVDPGRIDQVLFATSTPESTFPSAAARLANRIGAHDAGSHDVSAACSGFVYALAQAFSHVEAGFSEHVLVLGAETMSRVIDWTDRSTCILFGDGAGAVIVSRDAHETADEVTIELGSDASRADDLSLLVGGRLTMNGGEVYKFATRVMVDATLRSVERAGITVADIDFLVPHQANIRIIDHAVKRLGLDPERVLANIDRYGNTSAASIPLCLNEAWEDGRLTKGDRLLLLGFGGGLAWGSCLTRFAGPGRRQTRSTE